ncbi:MAG TPA: hypothetical protein DCX14_07900, partial [Flavobacteriales bacterium]|nr:hypothetical protein [Flavobacteriales bacterium]
RRKGISIVVPNGSLGKSRQLWNVLKQMTRVGMKVNVLKNVMSEVHCVVIAHDMANGLIALAQASSPEFYSCAHC